MSEQVTSAVARWRDNLWLLLPVAATLVAPGMLAAQWLGGVPGGVWPVVLGSAVLFLLTTWRMRVVLRRIVDADDQRIRLREELRVQSSRDSLTDLPHRGQVLELLEGALTRSGETSEGIALLFVDLDGFKDVNDMHGHAAGDVVLKTVAQRLRNGVRSGDVAGRLGGDEFVVLLGPVGDVRTATATAERLIRSLCSPITLDSGRQVRIGASIGLTFRDPRKQAAPDDVDVLLHEADLALYEAKQGGRGRCVVFTQTLRDVAEGRAALVTALERALQNDELRVHYQPILSVRTGELEGYEALVRWEPPGASLLSPAEFLPVAEGSDLVCDIDTWVLHRALAQLALSSERTGRPDLFMTVNISARHAAQARVFDDVVAALRSSGVSPDRVVLEITETALADETAVVTNLRLIRTLGVGVSLDDFGTGYCSIARLTRLPVDSVKIAREYLDISDPATRKLFQLMVEAAHTAGLTVIGEGVETSEQLALLRSFDCESAQGFLLGRPMPSESLEDQPRAAPLATAPSGSSAVVEVG